MNATDAHSDSGKKGWHNPIEWMARNAIAANLRMVILLGGGIWTAFNIQKEVFPQFALAMAVVYTLLAIAFGSYTQPLTIMSAIPFGIVFTTSIILVLVPCLYLILEDLVSVLGPTPVRQ
jgi:multidrug efflux pump subunit AcrB